MQAVNFAKFTTAAQWTTHLKTLATNVWGRLQTDPSFGQLKYEQWIGFGENDTKGKNLTDSNIIPLAVALETNPGLKVFSLDLSGNEITDAGASALAKALKVNKCLAASHPTGANMHALNLSNNRITKEGVKALAEAVYETGRGIHAIGIYDNPITENDFIELMQDPKIAAMTREFQAQRFISAARHGIIDKL